MKFLRKCALTRHTFTHTGERKYKCNLCTESFAQSGTLSTHRLTHIQNKIIPCPDPHCSQTFLTRKNLRNHLSIHSGEKVFRCGICGERFQKNSELVEHRHTHNLIFQCHICELICENQKIFKNHIRDHNINAQTTDDFTSLFTIE